MHPERGRNLFFAVLDSCAILRVDRSSRPEGSHHDVADEISTSRGRISISLLLMELP
jgi:hypothetical protein